MDAQATGPSAKAPSPPVISNTAAPPPGTPALPVAFAVLADRRRTWTYELTEGRAGKPTGKQVTLSVGSVEVRGAYTLIDLQAKGEGELSGPTLLVGPSGVREVLTLGSAEHVEAAFRNAYDRKYLPRVYLPAPLAPQRLDGDLERFGEDNRSYKLTGAVSQPGPHTWRTTWTGSFTIAEGEALGVHTTTRYEAVVEFDPGVGFTLICPADDLALCARLR